MQVCSILFLFNNAFYILKKKFRHLIYINVSSATIFNMDMKKKCPRVKNFPFFNFYEKKKHTHTVLMTPKDFKDIVGIGENGSNLHFLLFLQLCSNI